MERRVKEANDHWSVAHDPQDAAEITSLEFLYLVQSVVEVFYRLQCVFFVLWSKHLVIVFSAPGLSGLGIEKHFAHRRQPFRVQEHVLGPAESDAFCAHDQGLFGI